MLPRSAFYMVQLSHPYRTTGKTIALSRLTFVSKVMSLLFNTLPRFDHTFPAKEQVFCFVLFNFMATITVHSDFGAQENKICHFSPSICHEVRGLDAMILVFWMLSFKPAFSLSYFTVIKGSSSKGSLVPLHCLPLEWCHLHYWYFPWQSWVQLVIHPAWHFTYYTCIEVK